MQLMYFVVSCEVKQSLLMLFLEKAVFQEKAGNQSTLYLIYK